MGHSKTVPVDHPGTIIAEELEARGWQQVDLAYILGMLPQQLNPLLAGKANITPELATSLGAAFDMPADFFANLQKMYDLQTAKPVDPGIGKRASWLAAGFPVREMIKREWIEKTEPTLLDLQMMRFFGKNRIEDIPFMGDSPVVPAHAAKKSDYDSTTAVQYAWLHRVIKIAETIDAPLYSDEALRGSLLKIRAHLLDKDDLKHIPQILRACGVRYVLVESLPGAKIDGVCVWVDGQPAIGMTTRLDRMDNFAFVLRHEIEHILRGDGKEETFTPVDDIDSQGHDLHLPEPEIKANAAASEYCVPEALLDSFLARKGNFISEQDVLGLAARLEIHPAIVVGRIQRKREKYDWLRKYQTGIRKYLFDWAYKDGWGFVAPVSL